MTSDAWFNFDDAEMANISRTAQLAGLLGISGLRVLPASVAWVETNLGESDYDDITEAPWYDAGFPASAEFAGVMVLSSQGLDDSSMEAEVTEYVTAGGSAGTTRNATLPVVFSAMLLASTERGAEFGKRWLDRQLRGTQSGMTYSGAILRYFRYDGAGAPIVHRRRVKTTRGVSITRKSNRACAVAWWVTFTMTALDPYEYGEPESKITSLGGAVAAGPGVTGYGDTTGVETSCPVYDYSPIYDPLYPALVPSPTAPDFYPEGWGIEPGMTFQRHWARITSVEPSDLPLVPVVKVSSSVEARMVRVSIWPAASDTNDQCDPLFTVILSYLPAGLPVYVDGEREVSYAWDGLSEAVRRTDSLTYGTDASPIQWAAFNDPDGLLVSVDLMAVTGGGYEGGGQVRVALSLVPKSD